MDVAVLSEACHVRLQAVGLVAGLVTAGVTSTMMHQSELRLGHLGRGADW